MAQSKKFGTFAGVFTPSILTILGVIMYMRLGWVVGQVGLSYTIGIILVAHIISISTGLSISSIATDKKIKTGGIYYILSRSLGLPMGGAIGIALAFGTALSISLYIVGFAESFLGTPFMLDILGRTPNINDYRIAGTIVIILLVVLALISTSLALKTQFFILAAIVLSLFSIGFGMFINGTPAVAPINGLASESVSLEYVFSIFFPAVTGFTAGVAMSGDLKDPKKNIPSGTLLSIFVGLIIYIGLAVGFAYFTSRDTLINDTTFLMRIAWWSPLVLAGIWGATLSSALGGILGGPRILQAVAIDKILPNFIAKGSGQSHEPRNALIVIFLIAEIGILIGELNVIAEVVSMFYLASYGFINLAFALESWASTDFRPTFRIPRLIGIIGFMASFLVMFKLNMAAMVAALSIMLVIFLLLKRKEIQSDYGDVWSSVANSVIRNVLNHINKKEIEERNWQPNIILFSGNTSKRTHLLEFGKSLVGKHGLLSNFDLVENKEAPFLFSRTQQKITNNTSDESGIFTRRQTCKDIYQGIETIAATYGFSGIEPNTVLMGWARQTSNPKRFVELLNNLNKLDLNTLLIDYDKRYGYGNYKLIDIWWEEDSNHGHLALFLCKFLLNSEKWRQARVRLIITTNQNNQHDIIYANAEKVLEQLRINAEVKILNNQIEHKSLYELIRIESINSDILFLGTPELNISNETEFVEQTNKLMQDIGTVVVISASSSFKAMRLGLKNQPNNETTTTEADINILVEPPALMPQIEMPKHEVMAGAITELNDKFELFFNHFFEKYLHQIFHTQRLLLNQTKDHFEASFNQIKRVPEISPTERQAKITAKIYNKLITKIQVAINQVQQEATELQKNIMVKAIEYYLAMLEKLISEMPRHKKIIYTKKELLSIETENATEKQNREKLLRKIWWSGNVMQYKVEYKKLVTNKLVPVLYQAFEQFLANWDLLNVQFTLELEKIAKKMNENALLLQHQIAENTIDTEQIAHSYENTTQNIQQLEILLNTSAQNLKDSLVVPIHNCLNEIAEISNKINPNQYIPAQTNSQKITLVFHEKFAQIPDFWYRNQNLVYNHAIIELMLQVFENKLRIIADETTNKLKNEFEQHVYLPLFNLHDKLQRLITDKDIKHLHELNAENLNVVLEKEHYERTFRQIIDQTFAYLKNAVDKFPETIDILSSDSFNNFQQLQFDEVEIIHVSAARLLDYMVQQELIEPVMKKMEDLPKKIIKTNSVSQGIIRMLMYSFAKENNNALELNLHDKEKIEYIEGEKIKLLDQINEIKSYQQELERLIGERLSATINNLNTYNYIKVASNFKQYISKQQTKRRFTVVTQKIQLSKNWLEQQANNLWFRQSEAKLLARRINTENTRPKPLVDKLLTSLDQVRPNPEILEKVPFYYRQLFLQKHNYNNEYWVGRKKELADIEKSIKRILNGFHGALMITGEQNSGKTFLVKYALSQNKLTDKTFYIQAPLTDETKKSSLRKTLEKVTGISGTYKDIFNKIPVGSVIVFDDLELWWEKTNDGTLAIEQIMQWIDKYAGRILFVLVMNNFSYNLINKMLNLENYLINIVTCEPFNAQELFDIIMFRHESSGLRFKLNQRNQNQLRTINYAAIFARYFNASKGNIGTALYLWMSGITDYQNRTVMLRDIQNPDMAIFDELSAETNLFLLQFVLHKELTYTKLSRILLLEHEKISKQLNFMKRSGLIEETANNVFIINPYLNIYITEHLQNIEML